MNRILFALCFVGFSLGQIARVDMADGVALTLLDSCVALFVGFNAMQLLIKKKAVSGRLVFPILLFIIACLLSLIVNSSVLTQSQLFIAFLYMLRWTMYAGVYLILLHVRLFDDKYLLRLLMVAGGVHLLIGITQYFFFSDLRNLYYLGWDDHLYRLVGAFVDPNFQGAFFVLFLTVLLVNMYGMGRKNRKQLFLGILVLFFTLAEIVLTYSRSALLMLGSVMSVFLFRLSNKRIILLLSGIAIVFVLIFSNTYIEGLNPFRTASVYARLSSMQEAVTIIQDNPVFGVGFNAYRYAQNRYGFRVSELWEKSHADAGTDNSYLFVFATTGIIGLLAFLHLLWNMLAMTSARIGMKRKVPLIAFVSVIGIMVDSLFVNSLFYTFFMFWLWVLLAATENK